MTAVPTAPTAPRGARRCAGRGRAAAAVRRPAGAGPGCRAASSPRWPRRRAGRPRRRPPRGRPSREHPPLVARLPGRRPCRRPPAVPGAGVAQPLGSCRRAAAGTPAAGGRTASPGPRWTPQRCRQRASATDSTPVASTAAPVSPAMRASVPSSRWREPLACMSAANSRVRTTTSGRRPSTTSRSLRPPSRSLTPSSMPRPRSAVERLGGAGGRQRLARRGRGEQRGGVRSSSSSSTRSTLSSVRDAVERLTASSRSPGIVSRARSDVASAAASSCAARPTRAAASNHGRGERAGQSAMRTNAS